MACDFISRRRGLRTNAGIGVYSKAKEGNLEAAVREILESLGGMQNETVNNLAGEMFETVRN